jgi:two-component system, chemotaxis family, protein-glutamate methylesterase/glutaminase
VPPRNEHDIIVIGASAGGVETVVRLGRGLPKNLAASVFVVIHVSSSSTSIFPQILQRETGLLAKHPEDEEKIEHGVVYVAPPDQHMTLEPGRIRITSGPKHNLHRPAIDLLFRSAAQHYGSRVIGVVLTGFLDDGASGLAAIKNAGGITIVQDPKDATVPSMPASALRLHNPDYCTALDQIPELLQALVAMGNHGGTTMPTTKRKTRGSQRELTPYTCPDCHGTIWEVHDGDAIRFECRVGHSYSPETMVQANQESLERALWAALRALEESASLSRRLAANASSGRRSKAAKLYEQKAAERELHANRLRKILIPEKRRVNGGVKSVIKDDERQAS